MRRLEYVSSGSGAGVCRGGDGGALFGEDDTSLGFYLDPQLGQFFNELGIFFPKRRDFFLENLIAFPDEFKPFPENRRGDIFGESHVD